MTDIDTIALVARLRGFSVHRGAITKADIEAICDAYDALSGRLEDAEEQNDGLLNSWAECRQLLSQERARAYAFQRDRAALSDQLNGTPCAEIRWQQERETLESKLRVVERYRDDFEANWRSADIRLGVVTSDRDALAARLAEAEAARSLAKDRLAGAYLVTDQIRLELNAIRAERDAFDDMLRRAGETVTIYGEAMDLAREKLGIAGEGDGADRKADADDICGLIPALRAARAILAEIEARKV